MEEMSEILGPFAIILAPKSEEFTVEEVKEHTRFLPLAEYSYEFGRAIKPVPKEKLPPWATS